MLFSGFHYMGTMRFVTPLGPKKNIKKPGSLRTLRTFGLYLLGQKIISFSFVLVFVSFSLYSVELVVVFKSTKRSGEQWTVL